MGTPKYQKFNIGKIDEIIPRIIMQYDHFWNTFLRGKKLEEKYKQLMKYAILGKIVKNAEQRILLYINNLGEFKISSTFNYNERSDMEFFADYILMENLYSAIFINALSSGDNLKLKAMISDISSDNEQLNNELAINHKKLKIIRKKNRILIDSKRLPSAKEVESVALNSRFKSGNINYSEIGRKFGVSHHTAKGWCAYYGIRDSY